MNFLVALLVAGGVGSAITKFGLPRLFPAKTAPIAIISGNNVEPAVGETVSFNAFKSQDIEGEMLAFKWSVDSSVDIDLGNTNAGSIRVSFPTQGVYTVVLTVTDVSGLQSNDSQIVSVKGAASAAGSDEPNGQLVRSEIMQICFGDSAVICGNAELQGSCGDKDKQAATLTEFCKARYQSDAIFNLGTRHTQPGGQCGYALQSFWCEWESQI